jgi:hypothetical protein
MFKLLFGNSTFPLAARNLPLHVFAAQNVEANRSPKLRIATSAVLGAKAFADGCIRHGAKVAHGSERLGRRMFTSALVFGPKYPTIGFMPRAFWKAVTALPVTGPK